MIPEPVVGFSGEGGPDNNALSKLAAVLPPDDHCVAMDDPVTIFLDEIQANNLSHPAVRYFVSRVRPVANTDAAVDDAIAMVRRSFAGFRARARDEQAVFEGKLAVLRAVLAAERPVNPDMAVIAASSGFPDAPFAVIEARVTASMRDIEAALGVDAVDLGHCPRARDLALKLAARNLYLVISSLAEAVGVVLARQGRPVRQPSVLETLAYGVRRGLDHPDKIAFAHLRPTIRSRVLLHASFARDVGAPTALNGQDFQAVRASVSARLAFGDRR
jgi:hypothetical protein